MAKKGSNTAMIAEDRKWRAKSDAETLMRAEEIKKDPSRMKPAARELTRMDGYIKAATKKQ
jgi:hypothetical protein